MFSWLAITESFLSRGVVDKLIFDDFLVEDVVIETPCLMSSSPYQEKRGIDEAGKVHPSAIHGGSESGPRSLGPAGVGCWLLLAS